MFKYTRHRLKKIEELFKELTYTIRYERGSFQAGYCIVENRNVAVINKYFDTEARINCLLDILATIEVDESLLSDAQKQHWQELQKMIVKKIQPEDANTEEE